MGYRNFLAAVGAGVAAGGLAVRGPICRTFARSKSGEWVQTQKTIYPKAGSSAHSSRSCHRSCLSRMTSRWVMATLGCWQDTVVATYCELGCYAKENRSAGTDHGAADTQIAMSGGVKGGIKVIHPSLTQLNDHGNLIHTTDYRSLYASLLRDLWGFFSTQAEKTLDGKYRSIPLLRRNFVGCCP